MRLFSWREKRFCHSFLKAIAHYEQAADYYKGEESNRYCCHCFFHSDVMMMMMHVCVFLFSKSRVMYIISSFHFDVCVGVCKWLICLPRAFELFQLGSKKCGHVTKGKA